MTEKTFEYPTTGKAVDHLLQARKDGMKACYFPLGGDTAQFYAPISHHLWVQGTDEQIELFEKDETP